MRVYFHSPKRHGRPLTGKRARKFEAQGFERCASVTAVAEAREADAIYMRNIPEASSDALCAQLERVLDENPAARVINHPAHMQLHDAKDLCFEAWKEAGVPAPEHSRCEDAQAALEFAGSHESFFLRLNNEACGDDTSLLEGAGRGRVQQTYQTLARRARRNVRRGRAQTRVLAVALEGTRDAAGLVSFFRVFLVGGRIFGGYALVSRDAVVHNSNSCCDSPEEVGSFLRDNSILDELVRDPGFAELAARATAALRLDVACLDFVLADGEPRFLEANALWSPSYVWAGGERGRTRFLEDEPRWRARATHYCAWMDRAEFYRTMYEHFPRLAGW